MENLDFLSTDAAFSLFSVSGPDTSFELFAPHITSPRSETQFNQGMVQIAWDINDPPGKSVDITSDAITYEIEYTDNYQGALTNWYSLKKRIPYDTTSYTWRVGKMIKSDSVRIRMRARSTELQRTSEWSISAEFAVNVFKLTPPAIVNPSSNVLYTDYILIILDDSLSRDTYNQKVRYTFEYSSQKRGIDWTTIRSNVPFGQNLIRWNLEDMLPSDDYVLRFTVQNQSTSCFAKQTDIPDQISRRFVYNIKIQQPGIFIIDTKPPQALLEIENNSGITNQLEQTVNIFAEDETTEVSTIQMRECDASSVLALGDLEDPYDPTGGCTPINELLEDLSAFGKAVSNSAKLQWVFEDKSGLRKIEALLTDTGGNTSIQESSKIFLPAVQTTSKINDFEIVIEQRDDVTIDDSQSPPTIIVEPSTFEVVYFGTETGEFWVLEPYSRLLYTAPNAASIVKVIDFNGIVYFFSYSSSLDDGHCYRHDISEPTDIFEFPNPVSHTRSAEIYKTNLYVGLENGELWRFNGLSFTLLNSFGLSIRTLHADAEYLYIGFENSSEIGLYNGSTFTTLTL